MSNTWSKQLSELEKYIFKHPDIRIEEIKITIPQTIRSEFYRLFNEIREAFISEKFPELNDTTKPLTRSFIKTRKDVIELLTLDSIILPDFVERFIEDPLDSLMGLLWSPLFDLLKRKINIEIFEKEGVRILNEAYNSSYYKSYESWLELTLLKLFKSKDLLTVPIPAAGYSFSHAQSEAIHLKLNPVYPPIESMKLSLLRSQPHTSFTVPDFIIYSENLGKYVSARSEVREARWIATDASENRDWLPILGENKNLIFAPGYILLYIADAPEDIALINDVNVFCRPDMIIEFRVKEDWYCKEEIQMVKLRCDILKPLKGTYIITRHPAPLLELDKNYNIHTLEIGYNQSELKPIVAAFTNNNNNI